MRTLSNYMRTLSKLALVGALSASFVGLMPANALALEANCYSAAPADPDGVSCVIYHENAAGSHVDRVYFEAYGEVLHLSDYWANGEGVVAYVNGVSYYLTTGADTTKDVNLSFTEGARVQITSCQTDKGTEYDCHTEYATA
ncbi:hypothetical protein [Streptomyces sp. NBC_00154]|uniref:hypothetical protein n=1 Tax=Streptomyces sp. NBC_00154 TaxID=2975670 RepID=UPI00225A6762|nr:hypothetical protein [Streptomyces sp. NBC_00154]MCX5314033.1 hypothetical protein [Streptomyces sp. NBC_00154]